MSIRFHLDENVDVAVATGLRLRGVDVTTAYDVGLIGVPDEQQLAFAREQGRVVLTHDRDFLRLHSAGAPHTRIVYSHMHKRTIGEVVRALAAMVVAVSPEELHKSVRYL